MRVLVSGSTGLIGSALIPALQDAGHEPVRLVRSTIPDDLPVRRWDPSANTIDDDALDGIDAIVHLAGAGIGDRRWTDRQKERIMQSRVVGTTLLSDAIRRAENPPTVFLSGSAIGAYGDRGDELLNETSSHGTGFLVDVVEAWEAAAVADDPPTRTVNLRTGIVLSSEGGALGTMLPFFKFGIGGPVGRGTQWMSWIGMDDMVGALIWLLDSELRGPVNLTAPNPVTSKTFAKALGRVLRRPSFLPVPPPALWAMLGRELTNEMLMGSQRIMPDRLVDDGFTFTEPEIEGALRAVLDRPA
ncbi:MAG: TIGR01777 family oxidoreductase [Actinomycetota bacterium]